MALAFQSHAQSFRVPGDDQRSGKWDVTFQLITNESKTFSGEAGSSLSIRQRTGFGLGVYKNFNQHLALGVDFAFSSPRYTATLQPSDPNDEAVVIDHRANFVTGQLRGTWNILKGNLTPYVDVGGGFTFVDSNVVDSEVPPTCWWDPWYGTICNTSSYNDTNFSYSGSLGMRWDAGRSVVLKLSYGTLFIDTGASSTPNLNSLKFEIGARY